MSKEKFTQSPIVSSLPAYIQQNADQLIAKSQFGNTTARYITIQTGVKDKAKINLLNTTIAFRNGATCGFTATSSQTISQREIAVGHFAVNLEYCFKQLLGKYAEIKVKVSALGQEEMPFEEIFVNEVLNAIQVEADKAYWQGDKTNGSGNLALNDGILTIAAAQSSGFVAVNATSAATKFAQIEATIAALPASTFVPGTKVRIFVSPEYLMGLNLELVKANLYHFAPDAAPVEEILFPGTQIYITAVAGLSGAKKIVAANENNLFWGCDNENDEEEFDLWYSKDDKVFRLDVEFNLGAQVAFPENVVVTTVAA